MTGSLADLQFAALVALVAFVVFVVFVRHAPRSGLPRKEYRSYHANSRSAQNLNSFDVGQQLQAVMNAPFQSRRVMNSGEYQIFRLIEEEIFSLRRGVPGFRANESGSRA